MAACQPLSLIRIRLESISARRHIENPEPGILKSEQIVELSSDDQIDRDHPGVLRLTIRLKGEQKKTEADCGESTSPKDSTKTDAGFCDGLIAFELEATIVAVFRPRNNGHISEDEFKRCVEIMVLQTYPYLREWLTVTLDRMGVRVRLPLSSAISGADSIA